MQVWFCNFIKKETLAQVLSCEFYEISKNKVFTEYLRTKLIDILQNWVTDLEKKKDNWMNATRILQIKLNCNSFKSFFFQRTKTLPKPLKNSCNKYSTKNLFFFCYKIYVLKNFHKFHKKTSVLESTSVFLWNLRNF